MTLKIGNAEFEVTSLYAVKALRGVWHHSANAGGLDQIVYRWTCRDKPRVDPEGLVRFAIDCDVRFTVVKKSDHYKMHKANSIAQRKVVEGITGLKKNALVKAVRKAVKPIVIVMDARPTIDRVGKHFTFDVRMISPFQYYVLRPKGALDSAYIVIGIPGLTAFFTKIVKPCSVPDDPHDRPRQWLGEVKWDAQHLKWEREAMESSKEEEKEHKKRMKKENKKKGVRELPEKQ